MTRINADIHPYDLSDQHLMAEYRELPMVPAALRRSLRTKAREAVLRSVPERFTLGKGHVTFWYNKLKFLDLRYKRLQKELIARNFNIDPSRTSGCEGFSDEFYGDYSMSSRDLKIINERLSSRIDMKPGWYKHYHQSIV